MNAPWYKLHNGPHPYSVASKVSFRDPDSYHPLALFPWTVDSLETLWNGHLNNSDWVAGWKTMIDKWIGSVAIGALGSIRVVSFTNHSKGISVKLPVNEDMEVRAVAWALSQNAPLVPLVVYAAGSNLYVIDPVKCEISAYLAGHGGLITSITCHPNFPYLICTTSRDFSSRIFDLTLPPRQTQNNPIWPPAETPSLAGAPHGLQSFEQETYGIGRCVTVLVGGPSGGHRAAVLGAAFHPHFPLIATCGVDRAVKIWFLDSSVDDLCREDKPLFSSSNIHQAMVLSINWLNDDMLISHSAPAIMRGNDADQDSAELYYEDGTIMLWRWLGLDRFFPPNQPSQKMFRGCASDYQDSSSYQIIASVALPQTARFTHIFATPSHDPMVLVALPETIRMFNITHLKPRPPKPFPLMIDIMTDMPVRLLLPEDGDEEIIDQMAEKLGWEINIIGNEVDEDENLSCCVMGLNGGVIVVVGNRGTIWFLQKKP